MPKVRPDDVAHIKALQELCQQADKLSETAATLCQQLSEQMAATRASVLPAVPAAPERRRKSRKKR